jgi:hypothetical protein
VINRTYPTADDTPNARDPQSVARIVNASWTAHETLREYRASRRRTAADRLEARCEALEAALYHLATGQVG